MRQYVLGAIVALSLIFGSVTLVEGWKLYRALSFASEVLATDANGKTFSYGQVMKQVAEQAVQQAIQQQQQQPPPEEP